jgi:hypothetical protein
MACAHLAAAAVLGLWLAVGERALWTVLMLMTDRVCAALGRNVLAHYGALTAAWVIAAGRARRALALVAKEFPCPSPRTLALSRCVVRRGPPDLLAA